MHSQVMIEPYRKKGFLILDVFFESDGKIYVLSLKAHENKISHPFGIG